ncbi:DUF1826 domain-containing protein [Phaeobacter gallaeciensis]|uniref:DUF1826 domain-containing protein n=1 Tax=Phaeobacter gallaeciensis TaxID=60890 RepID=A0AAD0ECG1_9RHOB|nr:DUF1826 domain-containing protein [Phaeobacter gallaeciensis]AHD09110.1 hypothetical protein Gal_01343 [Phaeobacter gallaeciensis DSM 26640]ATE92373.1 hypothetical protein PhaeoP11_01334 [Phaeobacter gallaeciensis]ATE97805.1 hypothetical protein PhaeoP73_02512 [Phaeobacter gallaeciensis]ATF01038.1 hypothetical protein PhaeoP75_01384 [Phaeobacter gallaeciensis]ATF05418.1 hypothetical protein PhaeoP63_01332 [Phaeobacter gallaeciensis]
MTVLDSAASDLVMGCDITGEEAGLRRFLDPDCAALIWQRGMPADIRRWLEQIDPERLPRGRVIVQPESVARVFAEFCAMSGLPQGAGQDWLQAHVAGLAREFSLLMDARYLRFRLDVVTTNACRKFHVDAITARLVCTYRGTGTQLGMSHQGAEPAEVQTVATGSPLLLRGSRWPAQPASGLLHRSPPIEGTGETRLVLVLDPVTDPDDEMDHHMVTPVGVPLH